PQGAGAVALPVARRATRRMPTELRMDPSEALQCGTERRGYKGWPRCRPSGAKISPRRHEWLEGFFRASSDGIDESSTHFRAPTCSHADAPRSKPVLTGGFHR